MIVKATRKRKDSKVKGSTIFNAFLENKKLKPKIDDVSIPDKIGKIFVLLFMEFPPVFNLSITSLFSYNVLSITIS